MLAPVVAAAAIALAPTPADLCRAETLLRQPDGTPTDPDPHPAFRRALLSVMAREGAVDPECLREWWPPQLGWGSELDCARSLLARVLACPAVYALPPRWWLAEEANRTREYAATLTARARWYRDREAWEPDRAELLLAGAAELEREADRLGCHAARLESAAAVGWARPRRLVAADVGVVRGW